MTTNETLIRRWCAEDLQAARRMMVLPYRAGMDIGHARGMVVGAGITGRTMDQVMTVSGILLERCQHKYAKQIGFER